jgi:hypothetical protein
MTDDGRRGGRGMLALPLPPNLALCLCCHWLASGADAAQRAARHRDETSHAVVASPNPLTGKESHHG